MPSRISGFLFLVLSKADSNHHKQNQNLLCYHYTIGHRFALLQVRTFIWLQR